MSDQEINIAIAEACGWRQSERNIAHWHHVSEPYSHILTGDLPNYCNDLNAMHEAEKVLTHEQQIDYSRHIGKMVTSHLPASRAAWMDYGLINATARQRAEAFLRTIGKWKEAE